MRPAGGVRGRAPGGLAAPLLVADLAAQVEGRHPGVARVDPPACRGGARDGAGVRARDLLRGEPARQAVPDDGDHRRGLRLRAVRAPPGAGQDRVGLPLGHARVVEDLRLPGAAVPPPAGAAVAAAGPGPEPRARGGELRVRRRPLAPQRPGRRHVAARRHLVGDGRRGPAEGAGDLPAPLAAVQAARNLVPLVPGEPRVRPARGLLPLGHGDLRSLPGPPVAAPSVGWMPRSAGLIATRRDEF